MSVALDVARMNLPLHVYVVGAVDFDLSDLRKKPTSRC